MTGGAAARRKGDTFERVTATWLRDRGFYVSRSAGSLGIADLVALRSDTSPLLISCKVNGRIGPEEWAELFDTATDAGAFPLVAWRMDRAARPIFGYLLSRDRNRQTLIRLAWLNNSPTSAVGNAPATFPTRR